MARGKSSGGVRRLAQSIRHGLDAETPPEMAGYAQAGMGAPEGDEANAGGFQIEDFLEWDGNIAELFLDSEDGKRKLAELGQVVVREYKLDETSRKEWKESAERALEAAGQKRGEAKTYPFTKAADIKYPLLTTAAIQFAARAYPNIVRGDEVVATKINGDDADAQKAQRSERVADFCNDQIIYQCREWEPGTDALLHQLPITGAGFRKVYWDTGLRRPRFDYAPALKVVIPIDAPSLDMAPRVTHVLDTIYPHDYEKKVANGTWLKCEVKTDSQDSQKPIIFLEQCRYIDMDEDGLSEPYIVVVHLDTASVVRIDPAYDREDIKRYAPSQDGTQGKVYCIERLLPWVDYCFLPDPEGGAYGIGFGKLLEQISDTVNTFLNQMVDAGHLANTNTGFIGAGMKVRGGTISLEPNVFKMLDGVQNVRDAVHRLDFPGPSAVSFSLIELLLAAAKDITAIKDVLAGEMPGGQHVAEGTVLALIEQGLQVFTSIYKRIYRSMRREFELLCRLNQRYLDPADYQKFLDARPKPMAQTQGAPPEGPGMGHNGGPPMGPEDMGGAMPDPSAPPAQVPPMADMGAGGVPPSGAPPMPGPPAGIPIGPMGGPPQPGMMPMPQMMAPPPEPARDFDLADLDIRPVADPTAITDMQRMAKAQFLNMMIDDPTINRLAVRKYQLEAARIGRRDEFIVERNPALEKQQALAEAMQQAQIADTNAGAKLKDAQAAKAVAEAQRAPIEREREMQQRDRELNQKDIDLTQGRDKIALERYWADIEAADNEMRLIMEQIDGHRAHVQALGKLGVERQKVNGGPERRSDA